MSGRNFRYIQVGFIGHPSARRPTQAPFPSFAGLEVRVEQAPLMNRSSLVIGRCGDRCFKRNFHNRSLIGIQHHDAFPLNDQILRPRGSRSSGFPRYAAPARLFVGFREPIRQSAAVLG